MGGYGIQRGRLAAVWVLARSAGVADAQSCGAMGRVYLSVVSYEAGGPAEMIRDGGGGDPGGDYRGTSLIRNDPPVGPPRRTLQYDHP